MENQEVKTVKVKLLKPHEHAGIAYSSDMTLEVFEHDADWLISLEIAEKLAEELKAPLAKTTKAPEEK